MSDISKVYRANIETINMWKSNSKKKKYDED